MKDRNESTFSLAREVEVCQWREAIIGEKAYEMEFGEYELTACKASMPIINLIDVAVPLPGAQTPYPQSPLIQQ